ncbi:MAG: hypothetical protein J6R22_03010 [Alphaproteobacteria bacterium]|nr:hypothetical protein [Alphaproteobacteria bacterium]
MKKHIKALNDFKQRINNLLTDLNSESINSDVLKFDLQKDYLQYASNCLQKSIDWLIKYEKANN